MSELSTALLQTQLTELLSSDEAAEEHGRPIAVRHAGAWSGPDHVVIAGAVYPVRQADSVLGVRAALLEADGKPFVLLTSLERHALGREALARLFRRRIYAVDAWSLLLARFQASTIDPRLKERAVAEALIEAAPPGGFAPAPSGVLDEDTAWRALGRHLFGLDAEARGGGDLALLAWALDPDTPRRYSNADEVVRAELGRWLVRAFDGGTPGLAGLVAALMDAGSAPAPWLLLADTLFGAAEAAKAPVEALLRHHARGAALGGNTIQRLSAGLAALAKADGDELARQGDALDTEFAAQGAALQNSRYGQVGYRARLDRLAGALEGGEPGAWDAAQAISEHHRGTAVQREAVTALARLHAWLSSAAVPAGDLLTLAEAYIDSGCWVDHARAAAEAADFPGPVQGRVAGFLARVTARREAENMAFAQALAGWTDLERKLEGLCPVEHVVEHVVAPLAERAPVLVLLLDGLPLSIAHVLLDAVSGRDFHIVTTTGDYRAAVSTVPSRTEWARTSLFAGERRKGDLGVEKRAFAQHPALKITCRRGKPPALFHYADLKDRPLVETEITNPDARVVGVVLNAVDDELSGSAQYNRAWTLDSISGLSAILQAARDAGRTVLLTSDHGHVRHAPHTRTRKIEKGEGGQRWSRPRALEEGEVLFRGPRVAAFVDGGEVVVPGIEGLRYTGGKAAAGYHGGATPQEILAPLFVLWPSRNAESMPSSLARERPAFWHPPRRKPTKEPTPAPPAAPAPPSADPTTADLPLFAATAPRTPAAASTWSAALRRSELFAERIAKQPRLQANQVDTLIDALSDAGGQLSLVRLSSLLGLSEARVRGLAFSLRRALNVEGFPVLTINEDEGALELDLRVMRAQFELGES